MYGTPRGHEVENTPTPNAREPRWGARRIDCADPAHPTRLAPPARGGGNRDPQAWERGRNARD